MLISHREMWARIERARVLDLREPNGRFEVFLPAPTLHVTRASGELSHLMALRWMEIVEPVFERNAPLSNHHFWLEASRYDTLARRAVTRWAVRRASSCSEIRFLVGSKLIAMAVATVSLATALSGLTLEATSSEDQFNRTLLEALLERRFPGSNPPMKATSP